MSKENNTDRRIMIFNDFGNGKPTLKIKKQTMDHQLLQ